MPADESDVYRALSVKARLEMLRFIAGRPKTIQEVADRFGLTQFTARYHLRFLEDARMIKRYEVRGRRGKPRIYYAISGRTPLLTYPRREYQGFSELLLSFLTNKLSKDDLKQALKEVGRRLGRERMEELAARSGIESWTLQEYREHYLGEALPQEVGEVEMVSEASDRLVFRVYSCPVQELAQKYPDQLCTAMEQGIREGVVEATGGKLAIVRRKSLARGQGYCEFEVSNTVGQQALETAEEETSRAAH